MEILVIAIVFIISLFIGFYTGRSFLKQRFEQENNNHKEKINQLQQELSFQKEHTQQINNVAKKDLEQLRFSKDNALEKLRVEKEKLMVELTIANATITNLEEKLLENKGEIEKLQEKFNKEFENLANRILEEKSTKFTSQNKENLAQILTPLQEKILNFEKKVEETHKESIDRHASLRQQILGLRDLNERMSKEAVNLTKALKGDNKTQGNWGEVILERVLEKSGLEKGREYELEKSFDTNLENKTRLRPDVIINLPDNRKMIVDSKVTLTAYEQYANAEDEIEKEGFLKNHLISLNNHIQQLSSKKYEDLYQMESPDFVLLFIPIEPAFAVALKADTQLYNKAFDKNIVIVTPTTLLATLRTIESMWKSEKQQRNALEIARQAANLYDKFVSLSDNLLKLGNQLNTVQKTYQDSVKQLSTGNGNLITKVEKLKALGVKTSKKFNQSLLNTSKEKSNTD